MTEKQLRNFSYLIYGFIIILICGVLFYSGHSSRFRDFVLNIENASFDLRQTIVSKYKNPSQDIVILSVDDATYEYIMDKYGAWPISRKVWSDCIENIEKVNPKNIIFDMLFIKSNFSDKESDLALVNSVKKFNNVYLSMNFDNYSDEIRKSAELDDKFALKINQGALLDNEYISFINSRTIMPELTDVTDNVGVINVTRDEDGILRDMTPVFRYKNKYYPNLSLKVALDLLNRDSITIKNNTIIIDDSHSIPLDNTQRAILNWYGKSGTYKHIPLWQAIKAYKTDDMKFLKENFENKIIYIGTTATSLSDIKSTPVESNMSGIELHATFLNNILQNDFIKKVSAKINFLIAIILAVLTGYWVLKIQSVPKTMLVLVAMLAFWGLASTYLMLKLNLWLDVVTPYFAMITTFVLVYCEKYILKSKDYEQTYKLAVTDGLTQLYNHRYFQEQMIINVNSYKRYGNQFSLILIDIDFFKKFNDTYGHQSGDCVLKQVANILKKNSRTSDIACRYGGEEMAVILTHTNKQDAITTANKICLAVRNNKFILANGEKVNVTISVGVASVGADGETPQDLIAYSDKCLYKAKESGRNQVVFEV